MQRLVFDDSTRTETVRDLAAAAGAAGAYSAVASSLHRCCCSSTGITYLQATDMLSFIIQVLKLFSGTHGR